MSIPISTDLPLKPIIGQSESVQGFFLIGYIKAIIEFVHQLLIDPTNFLQPHSGRRMMSFIGLYTILTDYFDQFKSLVASREVNSRKYG